MPSRALALRPIPDAAGQDGHERYARRVDDYRQRDERQTPSPVLHVAPG